jgi:hypothetical protein
MSTANLFVWAAGLILQLVLSVALFVRGIARRFPVFASLIVFYVVRSVLLFALFSFVTRDAYAQLYDILSWTDLLLQILLALEIALAILRESGGWDSVSPRRAAIGMVLAFIACAVALGVAALLPAPGRVPVDRGAAFAAVLMLFLLAWAISLRLSGTPRRIVEGFALYGVAGVAIGLERSYAALYRNAAAYAAGSYAQAGIYMAVVMYWLLTLRAQQTPAPHASAVLAHDS